MYGLLWTIKLHPRRAKQMGVASLAIEPQFSWLLVYRIEFTLELMDCQQVIFVLYINHWYIYKTYDGRYLTEYRKVTIFKIKMLGETFYIIKIVKTLRKYFDMSF